MHPQSLDQFADLYTLVWIQSGGGFVEDEDGRIMDHRLREAHTLAVSFGEFADLLVLLILQAAHHDHLPHALLEV